MSEGIQPAFDESGLFCICGNHLTDEHECPTDFVPIYHAESKEIPRYRSVVMDPPWEYAEGFNGFGKRRKLPYPSMTVAEIAEIPVADLLIREGYLFLWTTNRYMPDAADLVRGWGFTYRQTLTWDKGPIGSGLGGMFATNSEFIVVAQNIRPGTNAHGKRTHGERVPTSVFRWPRGEHSAKPEAFQDLVEQVSPGPYLEMFARRRRLGWDSWGNEVDSDVEIAL